MNRRQFAFWLGFGLFSLSEKLRLGGLDRLAAATMRAADPKAALGKPAKGATAAVHWTLAGDDTWRWFERENYIKGQWVATGFTTPVNKKTGLPKWEPGGYLDEELVPPEVRAADATHVAESPDVEREGADAHDPHLPAAQRRGRHGRPPSKWLRSLHAYELRTWLKTVEVPEAGVSGMTVWSHLTRDHLFDPHKIVGLSKVDQLKLHAAAHFGY